MVTIIEPDTTTIYPVDQKIQLKISNAGNFPLQKIDVFINGTFMDTIKAPFNFSFIPEELDNLKTQNELKIISYDAAYNRTENTSTFNVNQ